MEDNPLEVEADLDYPDETAATSLSLEKLADRNSVEQAAIDSEEEISSEKDPDSVNSLDELLYEKGHVFSNSHLLARYQFVKYTSTYRTPQGYVVVPRAADTGSPVVARRFAGFTIQRVQWTACRFRVKPELPAVEVVTSKTCLDCRITGESATVLTDGKTLLYTLSGEYRYVLDTAKKTVDTFDMPGNPALDPTVGAWRVEKKDFIEGSIP